MTDFGGLRVWFGSTSGSAWKALRRLEEPHVMVSHVAHMNQPPPNASAFADCGGYSMLHGPGEYTTSADEYLDYVESIDATRFALRDYPCEESARQTDDGLASVADHQRRTVEGHLDTLDALDSRPDLGAKPVAVVQGWSIDQYLDCIDAFEDAGIFDAVEYVALGSVCRRNQSKQVAAVIRDVVDALPHSHRDRVHAFGVKSDALTYPGVAERLDSVDTTAWYFRSHSTPSNHYPEGVEPSWHTLSHRYVEYKRGLADRLGLAESKRGQSSLESFGASAVVADGSGGDGE